MKYIFLFALMGLLAACNNNENASAHPNHIPGVKTADSIYEAVIHKHDEAMALMGPIIRATNQMQQIVDSIKSREGTHGELLDTMQTSLQDLKDANDRMDHWMTSFIPDTLKADQAKRNAYMEHQLKVVTEVDQDMRSSIDRAKYLVETH